jgi:hypothetical protein
VNMGHGHEHWIEKADNGLLRPMGCQNERTWFTGHGLCVRDCNGLEWLVRSMSGNNG